MGAATQDSNIALGCSSFNLHHMLLHATLSHAWPSAPIGASLQHFAVQTADTQLAATSNKLQEKRNIVNISTTCHQCQTLPATFVNLQHQRASSMPMKTDQTPYSTHKAPSTSTTSAVNTDSEMCSEHRKLRKANTTTQKSCARLHASPNSSNHKRRLPLG